MSPFVDTAGCSPVCVVGQTLLQSSVARFIGKNALDVHFSNVRAFWHLHCYTEYSTVSTDQECKAV